MPYFINDAHFPLVVSFAWDAIFLSDVAYLDEAYRTLHARGEVFCQVIEVCGSKVPGPDVRKALGDLTQRFEPDTEKHLLGNAVVLDSRLAAGALTAIQWVSGQKQRIHYASSMAHAIAHVLNENGDRLTVPPAGLDYVAKIDAAVADNTIAALRVS